MQQRGSSSNATHEDNKRNVWNQDTPSEVPDEIHEFKTIKVNKLLALSINRAVNQLSHITSHCMIT